MSWNRHEVWDSREEIERANDMDEKKEGRRLEKEDKG